MIGVGMALLWGSYSLAFWGYSMIRGWNLSFAQVVSPTAYYGARAGQKWPPATAGNAVVVPDGTAASVQTAAFTAPSSSVTAGTPPSGKSGNATVQSAAARFGWGSGSAWACILALLAAESGGNPLAVNGSATCDGVHHAFGAFQSCSHGGCGGASCGQDEYCGYGLSPAQTKLANCGNLYYQAIWGMNYIKAEYGSPCNIPGVGTSAYRGY